MNFESDYSNLLSYAESLVIGRGLNVDPSEIVNDAYLKLFDSGLPYNIQEAKRFIKGSAFGLKKEYERSISFDETYRQKGATISSIDMTCTCCKEVKPSAAFRTINHKNGNVYFYSHCRACEGERCKRWVNQYRDKWNKYVNEWKKKKGIIKKEKKMPQPIHDLWKAANKRYQEKQKEQLTDVYIRGLLKGSGKNITPETIELKRKQLIEKREYESQLKNFQASSKKLVSNNT